MADFELTLTDNTRTIDLALGEYFALTESGWQPTPPDRVLQHIGGRSRHTDSAERINVTLTAPTRADLFTQLALLSDLMDQAEAWINDEEVDPVYVTVKIPDSSRSTAQTAIVTGPNGDQPMIRLPSNYVDGITALEVGPIELEFLHRPWLGDDDETGAWYEPVPTVLSATFNEEAIVDSPTKVDLVAFESDVNLLGRGYLIGTSGDVDLSCSFRITPVSDSAASLTNFALTAETTTGAVGDSIARLNAASNQTGAIDVTANADCRSLYIYAAVRKSSATTEWRIRGRTEGVETVTGNWRKAIDSTDPQVIDLGLFESLSEFHATIALDVETDASTGTLDINYICFVRADQDPIKLEFEAGSYVGTGSVRDLVVDHRAGTAQNPIVYLPFNTDTSVPTAVFNMRDDFNTEVASGAFFNGRACEPDDNGLMMEDQIDAAQTAGLSIVDGQIIADASRSDTTVYWQSSDGAAFSNGLTNGLFIGAAYENTGTGATLNVGADANAAVSLSLGSASVLSARPRANAVNMGPQFATGDHTTGMWIMGDGRFYHVHDGRIYAIETDAPMTASYYAGIYTVTANAPVNSVRIADLGYLPVPWLSDGFSSTTSDGLGHYAGTADLSIGRGGDARSWTDSVGTWTVSGGERTPSALSGGLAICTVDPLTDRLFIYVNITGEVSGAAYGLVTNYIDSNNYMAIYYDRTTAFLTVDQVVSGSTTNLATSASLVGGTNTATAIQIVLEDDTIYAYCARESGPLWEEGSSGAVSVPAGLQSGTAVGLYCDNTSVGFGSIELHTRSLEAERTHALMRGIGTAVTLADPWQLPHVSDTFTIRDEFAATAESGTRVEYEANSGLVSINSSGYLSISGSSAWGDATHNYTDSMTRTAGLAVFARIELQSTGAFQMFGFRPTEDNTFWSDHGAYTDGNGVLYARADSNPNSPQLITTIANGTAFDYCEVIDSSGKYIFIDGVLIWMDTRGSTTPLYTGVATLQSSETRYYHWRVPTETFPSIADLQIIDDSTLADGDTFTPSSLITNSDKRCIVDLTFTTNDSDHGTAGFFFSADTTDDGYLLTSTTSGGITCTEYNSAVAGTVHVNESSVLSTGTQYILRAVLDPTTGTYACYTAPTGTNVWTHHGTFTDTTHNANTDVIIQTNAASNNGTVDQLDVYSGLPDDANAAYIARYGTAV